MSFVNEKKHLSAGKSIHSSISVKSTPPISSETTYHHPNQHRILGIIQSISDGMYEREEIIAVALLAAFCGQNTFLYGPPGTAKSLIARQIARAFKTPQYFEYLMNRFSTPEEVFGPVSIKALKEDVYLRKTDNYLPTADFAFLDEIWKASPAILNTLLTLINERIYRNGDDMQEAPLKALIAASNETPETGQGLDAIYDRFVVRLMVNPIMDSNNFDRLLSTKPHESNASVGDELVVQTNEWSQWTNNIHDVQLSSETLSIIRMIRQEMKQQGDIDIYVSDRRWQRIAILLKASAFFNGRVETNHSDALLLQHCLWTHQDNRNYITHIVLNTVRSTGFILDLNLEKYDTEKESLENEITRELFYTENVYDTRRIGEDDYFYCQAIFPLCYEDKVFEVYIPTVKSKTTDEFHPKNSDGIALKKIKGQFDGQGTCVLSMFASWAGIDTFEFVPAILFHRGEKKHNVNKRLISSLAESVADIRTKLTSLLAEIDDRREKFEQELLSPFVEHDQSMLAIEGVVEQTNRIKLRIKDCARLESLCQ